MKHKFYLHKLMLFMVISSLCSTQTIQAQNTLPLDFETTSGVFTTFGVVANVVTNPDVSATNSSGSVMEVVRSGPDTFSGGYFDFSTPFDFSVTNAITMKVYSPRTGVVFKLKVEGGASPLEIDQTITVANEWVELAWNFGSVAPDHTRLTMFFDAGQSGDGTANSTFYFDDVDLFNTTIKLPIDMESNVVDYKVSDFGGSSTSFGTDPINSLNKVGISTKSTGAETFAGVIVGTDGLTEAIPFTATAQKLAMRVYSPLSGIKVRMKVEDKTTGSINMEAETTTSFVNTWEQLVFDFGSPVVGSLNLANTYDKITIFFNFDAVGSNNTYYWDDIAFISANNLLISQNTSVAGITINSGETVTVSENATLTVQGNITNNGTFDIESGSSLLTYAANTISGNAINIKRNTRYADGKYSFVGTPVVQDASITEATLGTNVYYYDETEAYSTNEGLDRWDVMNGELVPGTGYTQAFKQEIIFNGIPNTGTITYNGTYTEDTDDANEGWNLVANPYAAAINVAAFLTANNHTSGSVYIWDDNGSESQRGSNSDYIVANGTMASATAAGGNSRYNNHLGATQGFFVKFNSVANTDITFTEDMRRVDENLEANFFRKDKLPIARINLSDDSGLFKQTVLGIAADATIKVLNQTYDAQAFNASADFGLFTLKAGRALTLNGMNADWERIQLQLNTVEAGNYQFAVELDGYAGDVYLKDNLTGEMVDLKAGNYSFHSSKGIHTDRFELLSSTRSLLGFDDLSAHIYAYDKTLYIQSKVEGEKTFQLFNMQGQKVNTFKVQSNLALNLSNLAQGIYLVFDGQKTHKIILD